MIFNVEYIVLVVLAVLGGALLWRRRGRVKPVVSSTVDVALFKKPDQELSHPAENALSGSWDWKVAEGKLYCSEGLYALFGVEPGQGAGLKTFAERVHPEDRQKVQAMFARALKENGNHYEVECRVLATSLAGERIIQATAEVVRHKDGSARRMIGAVRDVSEQRRAEQALRASEVNYRGLFDSVSDAIYIQDVNGCFLDVNRGAVSMYGYTREEMVGLYPTDLSAPDKNDHEYLKQAFELALTGEPQSFEFWGKRKNGEIFPKIVRLSKGNYFGKDAIVAMAIDITERKKMEEALAHMAHHDALTGLPNRQRLTERVERAIHRAARVDQFVALLFIDLDRFKQVNDLLGHAVGDKLIEAAAERLRSVLRQEDTVARIGGDEFVVLMEAVKQVSDVTVVARKLVEAMDTPFLIDGGELFVTGSIGVSLFPQDGADCGALLKNADAAMYKAKEEGRNTFRFYTEEITNQVFERMRLESKLRAAIAAEEFLVHFQPLVDLATGRIVGAEALVRWQDKEWGMVSPVKFIPLAEETGLVTQIGAWVLKQSCIVMKRWTDLGLFRGHETMNVNVSGRQLEQESFVTEVLDVLAETGLNPACLQLEITEGMLMKDPARASAILHRIRDAGVGLAIDDFGTGYSSLSYLKKLPITKLKIDRSFVRDIPADGNDEAIARAVIALGSSMQLKVVAEGVETWAQESFLLREGCDLGQGFLYSKPVSADEFEGLLKAQRRADNAARKANALR